MFTVVRVKMIEWSMILKCILLIVVGYFFYESISHLFSHVHYVFIHTLLEIISVTVCYCISMFGWKAYAYTLKRYFLWLTFLFFSIGFLDLLHLMNYPGMSPFITESSVEKLAWFWIAARLTTSVGLFFVVRNEYKEIRLTRRSLGIITLSYLVTISTVIYSLDKQLPLLVDESGPTALKIGLEYVICLFSGITLVICFRRYIKMKEQKDAVLLVALSLIFLSEFALTTYTNISNIFQVIGHLIKDFGYFYILRAYFWTNLQLNLLPRKEVEKNLKQTQELLQSFYFHTPDSIAIMETSGKILAVNQGFVKLYGWTEEEVKGKLMCDLMPNVAENINEVIQLVSSGRDLVGFETIREKKDGSRILVNMTIFLIRNEENRVMRLAVISRDMTSQRQAEQKLLDAEREFQEIINLHQGMIFKVVKVGNDFVITFCDGQLLYEIGHKLDMVIGQTLFSNMTEKNKELRLQPFMKAWKGEECTFEGELEGRTLIITVRPVIKDGTVVELVGSCIDVTQLKKTEEFLQKSKKLVVVGELAAGIAHEIRNPLTTLKGFTKLMKTQLGEEQREYLMLMLSELDRIEFITNEFITLAKPEAMQFQKQDVYQLLKHVVQFFSPQAFLKGIQIDELYEKEEALILGEGNQIKQAFINVLKNAMEAMEHGGVLRVHLKEDMQRVIIRITDTGMGISKEILPKLGEPFYTLKEKGIGLGLMVSFRIIEFHSGSIQFESEEGVGTTVEISFPLLDHGARHP